MGFQISLAKGGMMLLTIHGKWEGRNSRCKEADGDVPGLTLLSGCAITAKL